MSSLLWKRRCVASECDRHATGTFMAILRNDTIGISVTMRLCSLHAGVLAPPEPLPSFVLGVPMEGTLPPGPEEGQ